MSGSTTPTTTLSKFGVPLGDNTGRGGLLQLKYKYRFRVRTVNFGPIAGGLDLTQQVQSVGKPKYKHESIAVHSYNSTAYFAGKHEWEEIELTVKDDVTNNVTVLVAHQQQKQLNVLEQTGYLSGVNYKFSMFIEDMDGGNDTVLSSWYLEGCWLSDVDYTDLDYTKGGEFQLITMKIRYDNATLLDGLMTDNPDETPGFTVG